MLHNNIIDLNILPLHPLHFAEISQIRVERGRPGGGHCGSRSEGEGGADRVRDSRDGQAPAHLPGQRQRLRRAPRPLSRPRVPEVVVAQSIIPSIPLPFTISGHCT